MSRRWMLLAAVPFVLPTGCGRAPPAAPPASPYDYALDGKATLNGVEVPIGMIRDGDLEGLRAAGALPDPAAGAPASGEGAAALDPDGDAPLPNETPAAPATGFYALQTQRLDGTPVALARWAGRVTLVVNTASECGLTPQYEQLEALHDRYAAGGRFEVLGFPCNQFGGQEPGTPEDIASFCSSRYAVTFPLFAKCEVKGDDQSEVFAYLTRDFPEPEWNFRKYLVGADGTVLTSFDPPTRPDAPEVVSAIEAALGG